MGNGVSEFLPAKVGLTIGNALEGIRRAEPYVRSFHIRLLLEVFGEEPLARS
jgi:hypothetical protein